ncbi:peptidoglycan DD-metalloendopeptidase family protein [Streptomyces sp. TRM64462]|uniref:peptidoglycan DD-metalloendopeptidase family protein n=1 Tax=Streptomyces sp. TRM64462 TaxID=2741726 RepID=UPI00158690CE|nr:peptidoglycan DD-metalloendopeptidase family protein [Streptomyces sp. TRM64462]
MRHPHAFFGLPARRRLLSALLLTATAVPLTLAATTAPAAAASRETWEKVAACESSNNWSVDTGNGFYGGLQFLPSTWAEFGGHQYAPNAHLATKEQQIAVAEEVLKVQGPGAWPVCSVRAGLTRGGGEAPPPTPAPAAAAGAPAAAASRLSASAPVLDAVITARYRQPGGWAAGYHTGVDFAVPTGTQVWSAAPGTVVSAGWQGAYGNAVVVRHVDGMFSLYAHLSAVSVSAGEQVTAGQQLGLSGSTGNSTGPHLHFEVRTSNTYSAHTDPLAYLRSLGVAL